MPRQRSIRLQNTLAATTQEREQGKAERLQYAEQLLEDAMADFKNQNGSINTLETHLDRARNDIISLMGQLDYIKEEFDSLKEELKHAYELCHKLPETRRVTISLLPSRIGSVLEPRWKR